VAASVKIYTTKVCPYCVKAKRLLDAKDVDYVEVDVSSDDKARDDLVKRSEGRRTVPQIFINGKAIGGCDDLHALEESGELDKLLA
jgi:glutaredoxin 3